MCTFLYGIAAANAAKRSLKVETSLSLSNSTLSNTRVESASSVNTKPCAITLSPLSITTTAAKGSVVYFHTQVSPAFPKCWQQWVS